MLCSLRLYVGYKSGTRDKNNGRSVHRVCLKSLINSQRKFVYDGFSFFHKTPYHNCKIPFVRTFTQGPKQ